MFSLLSKYQKHVMAGISMLLLVVFLAPSAVSRCSTVRASASTTWATTTDGKPVTLGELEAARGQIRLLSTLQSIARDILRTRGTPGLNGSAALMWLAVTDLKEPALWILISREARDAGLVGGQGDGRAFLANVAASAGVSPDQLLGVLATNTQMQPSNVLLTLADLAGVERLMSLVVEAPRAGDSRQRLIARELLTTVSADVVPISASSVGDAVQVPPPSLAEMELQFEQAKLHLPGTGPAGAGYKHEDRVSVEWLAVPLAEISRSVLKDPAFTPVELRKEFLRNPAAYAPAAVAGTAPIIPTFEEARDRVVEVVRQRLTTERVEKISAFIRDWSRAAMRDLPTNGGLVTLPADWETKKPSFAELAQQLSNKFQLPLARLDNSGPGLIPVRDVDGKMFIGGSTTKEFGQPMTVGALITQFKEFNSESKLPLQAGVVGPILATRGNDLIAFRVTIAEPARAPSTMADVQDAVIKDATTTLRYAELVRQQQQVLQKAETAGLAAIANEYNTVVDSVPQISLANTAMLMRGLGATPSPLSRAGSDAAAVRAVLQRAVSLPTDRPVSALPESQRMLTIPVPSKQLLLVVRINEVRPLSLEEWNQVSTSGAILRALVMSEPGINLPELFSLERMQARHGFKLVNPDGPDRPQRPDMPQF
jgi:hypothetical protein